MFKTNQSFQDYEKSYYDEYGDENPGNSVDIKVVKKALSEGMDPMKAFEKYIEVLFKLKNFKDTNPKYYIYILNVLMNVMTPEMRKNCAETICKKLFDKLFNMLKTDEFFLDLDLEITQFLLSYFIYHGGRKYIYGFKWRSIPAIAGVHEDNAFHFSRIIITPQMRAQLSENIRTLSDNALLLHLKKHILLGILKSNIPVLLELFPCGDGDGDEREQEVWYNRYNFKFNTRAIKNNGSRNYMPSSKAKSVGGR